MDTCILVFTPFLSYACCSVGHTIGHAHQHYRPSVCITNDDAYRHLCSSLQDTENVNWRYIQQVQPWSACSNEKKMVTTTLFQSFKRGSWQWNTINMNKMRNGASKNTQNSWYKIAMTTSAAAAGGPGEKRHKTAAWTAVTATSISFTASTMLLTCSKRNVNAGTSPTSQPGAVHWCWSSTETSAISSGWTPWDEFTQPASYQYPRMWPELWITPIAVTIPLSAEALVHQTSSLKLF